MVSRKIQNPKEIMTSEIKGTNATLKAVICLNLVSLDNLKFKIKFIYQSLKTDLLSYYKRFKFK